MKYLRLLSGIIFLGLSTPLGAVVDEDPSVDARVILNYFAESSLAGLSRDSTTLIEAKLRDFLKKNLNELNLDLRRELSLRLAHLSNFNKIRDAFAKCLLDTQNSRSLPQRILDVAAQTSLPKEDCVRALRGFAGQAQDISNSLTNDLLKQFLGRAVNQSERNTFHSYLDYRRHHTPPVGLEKIVSDYCEPPQRNPRSPNPSLCPNRQEYLKHAQAYTQGIPSLATVRPSNQVAQSLNDFLSETWFLEKSSEYDITDMDRLLVVTPSLRNKIEAARKTWKTEWESYQTRATGGITKKAQEPRLRRPWLQAEDIEEAREEMAQGIRRSQLELAKMNRSRNPKQLRKELKFLLSTNPVAIGQTLIRDPDFTPLLCELIQETYRDDYQDETYGENILLYAGIVGGGLLATGALSWVAPMVLGIGATASTALAATTAVSFGAAGAIAAAGTAYTASQALEKYNEAQKIESALLSTNGDQYSEMELKKAIDEYHLLTFRAVTELGLSATGVGALKLLARSGRLEPALHFLREILSSTKIGEEMPRILKSLSPESQETLLLHLGELSQSGIRNVLEELGKLSGKALVEFVEALAKKTKQGTYHYIREVKWTAGKRVLIRSRQTGQPRWDPLGMINNPVATLLDRRRQVTIPVSLMGESAAISGFLVTREMIDPSPEVAEIASKGKNVEGGAYLAEAVGAGLMETRSASELLEHQRTSLRKWVNDPKGETRLPRADEFLRLNLVDENGLKRLDQIAREVYAAVHAPGSSNPGDSNTRATTALLDRLKRDPVFSQRDPEHLLLMADYLLPQVKVDQYSDTQQYLAIKKSIAENREIFNVKPETYRAIDNFARESELPRTEVLAMISAARNDPSALKFRQDRAKRLLPSGKQYIGQRPNVPGFNGSQKWQIGPNYSVELQDELDAYRLFNTLPYFEGLRDGWEKGEIKDVDALIGLSTYARGMSDLMTTAPKGVVSREGAEILLFDNPLFTDLKEVIDLIGTAPSSSSALLNRQERQNCIQGLVQIRATFLLKQADSPLQTDRPGALAELNNQTQIAQAEISRRCGIP